MTLEERINDIKLLAEKQLYATGRIGFNTEQAQTNGKIKQAKNDLAIINELQQKNDLLQLEKGELIKALNFIRSSDSSTESAAKAIEMLKKYEVV